MTPLGRVLRVLRLAAIGRKTRRIRAQVVPVLRVAQAGFSSVAEPAGPDGSRRVVTGTPNLSATSSDISVPSSPAWPSVAAEHRFGH